MLPTLAPGRKGPWRGVRVGVALKRGGGGADLLFE
jgi:hypothetical protein